LSDTSHGPLESWYHERESAWLYRVVAKCEPVASRRQLFESLAGAAEEQAEHWARMAKPGVFQPRLRARIIARLLHWFGPRSLRSALVAMKLRGMSVYDTYVAPSTHDMPKSMTDVGARHRSVSGGNNLRAAVFGVNDGLVSNASLIIGIAGAGAGNELLVTSGVAGLLAGALSMAAGEYISVRSQREMYEYQIGLERAELAEYPEEEAEELALIYQARGMDLAEARSVANRLIADPDRALNTLAREELGLNPDDLASPWLAALFSFFAFGAGALIPLLPLLFGGSGGQSLLPVVAGLTLASLFAVGATLSLFSGQSAIRGGLRMMLIGAAAAACTFVAGRLFNVAVG
jgi:VIT1/CCC1 family predicted Fe2+/Mn2+ transporter